MSNIIKLVLLVVSLFIFSACDGSGVSSNSVELDTNESAIQNYSLRFDFNQINGNQFSFTPIVEPAVEGGEYEWFFDGDIYEEDKAQVSVPNPTIRYVNSGIYYVYYKLTIDGKTYISTAKFVNYSGSSEAPLEYSVSISYNLLENNKISFNVESGDFTSEELSNASYEWNFGDSVVETDQANVSNPQVTFSNTGEQTVTVKVTSSDGAKIGTGTITINVGEGVSSANQ